MSFFERHGYLDETLERVEHKIEGQILKINDALFNEMNRGTALDALLQNAEELENLSEDVHKGSVKIKKAAERYKCHHRVILIAVAVVVVAIIIAILAIELEIKTQGPVKISLFDDGGGLSHNQTPGLNSLTTPSLGKGVGFAKNALRQPKQGYRGDTFVSFL